MKKILLYVCAALVTTVALATPAGASEPFDSGLVSITFDDGWRSQHTLARQPLLNAGMRATFYLNTNPLNGWSGYMQQAHVEDMIADGHEIGSHTVSHPDLTTLSDSALQSELTVCRDTLAALFSLPSVPSFASPFGAYDARVKTAIADVYGNHRTVTPGLNWRNGDVMELRAMDVAYYNFSAVTAMIDAAVAQQGWVILVAHEIVDGPAPSLLDYSLADFEALLAYIQASGATVVTVAEGAALMGATVPEPPAGTDLIDDFETAGTVSKRGTWWYTYADGSAGGNSQASSWSVSPGAGGSQRALRFAWQLGTAAAYPYLGLGLQINPGGAVLGTTDFTGLQVDTRGHAATLRVIMNTDSTQNGYASYRVTVQASPDWSTQVFDWAAFSLPTWSPNSANTYPLDPSRIVAIDISQPSSTGPGSSGTLDLDNLAFRSASGNEPEPEPTYTLLDDHEHGGNVNLWGGYWYTYRGGSGSSIAPAAGASFTMHRHDAAPVGTSPLGAYGARMTWQTGGSGDYVGMGTSLSSGGAAVDLSGFTGITFEATGNTTYAVSVTMDTDSTQNGWISYRAFFTPSAGWQTFNLDWSAFALPAWSPNTASAYPLDTSRISGINFVPAGAASSGTLTVDDIRF